ncbi:MAG: hypothetical protein AAFX99_13780 [Myxococcota bacterium]
MQPYPLRDMTTEPQSLVDLVPADEVEPIRHGVPEAMRDQVVIDVIHDGHWLPEEFLVDRQGKAIDVETIQADFVRERDWGALLVAKRLAGRLGLPHVIRVNVARVLMDFGRFPGSTPRHADHLNRHAINYPFSSLLSYPQKKQLLERYYDGVSSELEGRLRGKRIKIAIHTYDRHNSSGTERPATSLMTRSIAYQISSELPGGLFDPLYPDILAEFTCDRVLRDRISLTLEKAGIPVAHNYPYCLPEGSLEVRYQVWAYFCALREAFELAQPHTQNDPCFAMIWEMLMDTNLRSSLSDALRGYLHMYRRAPDGREALFNQAADAYAQVRRFSAEQGDGFVEAYRFAPERTSSIAIEVRKDIVCALGEDGLPLGVHTEHVHTVADRIAEAVVVYLRHDMASSEGHSDPELERHAPWYLRSVSNT